MDKEREIWIRISIKNESDMSNSLNGGLLEMLKFCRFKYIFLDFFISNCLNSGIK